VSLSPTFSELDPRTTTPVSNLSRYGVFVHMSELQPVGAVIDICFTVFEDNPVLFRAVGRVVRHQDDPRGMGVEFEQIDDANIKIVEEILRRYDNQREHRTTRRRRFQQAVINTRGLRARLVGESDGE
jgi:hypothetical protein